MKIIITILILSIAAIGVVGCTGIYTDPGYPVVSGGSYIHQSHYPSYHPRRYYGSLRARGPAVHVGRGTRISQSHY